MLYAAVALAGPVLLLWAVRGLGALQRARFRAVLGVEIPAPPRRAAGSWALRPVRAWRAAGTWRQLGYHLLASWSVGSRAACWWRPAGRPRCWPSPGSPASWATARACSPGWPRPCCRWPCCWRRRGWPGAWPGPTRPPARALLGPSRSEELALRVESLARSRADIVAATDAERRRIERDLHDGAQQRLVSLAMNLGMARASLTDAPEPVRQVIAAGPRRGHRWP